MANTLSLMTNAVRGVVSGQRIRYQQNGFDLDLAYVCDNIIAMGYPAANIESIFRNNCDHVYQFFEEKHKDHYKIYNLCSERNYDGKKFHGRVSVYPFDDHNPPPITLIKDFCDDVDAWLKADRNNVAAVHCKAGKGRTGTMICCYLVHSKLKTTAEDALAFYDDKRTKNRKGVTIPSQRRYVEYYAKLVNSGQPYEERTVQICEIKFSSQLSNQDNVYCSICNNPRSDSDPDTNNITLNFRKTQTIVIDDRCIPLTGDVKVEIYRKVMKKKEKYFHFWFNTYFLCDTAAYVHDGSEIIYELSKNELDDAHKDTVHKTVPEDFKVRLVFKLVARHQQVASNENSHNNHHVIQGQLQNHKNHNNQLPNNLNHNSINSQAASIGPTAHLSLDTGNPLPQTIGLNHKNQQHLNQKNQQNSDSNPTKRKHHHQNHNNQNHLNDRETFGSVVLRQSDEDIKLKLVNNDQGSVDGDVAEAGAVILTPSESCMQVQISTNSSSRSSSINSEGWESGESIISKDKECPRLVAMTMDADYSVKHSSSSSSHPNINLSSSSSNCTILQLCSLENEMRRNNNNLNNNNRKSSIDIEESKNNASNDSGSSTSSKLIPNTGTGVTVLSSSGSKPAKSKSLNKSLGLHNTKKVSQKRRWLSNMKSDPDLCETLVKSVHFRNTQTTSGGMMITGAGVGGPNRTRNNSTTDHDDYYSSLCDKQLSFGGVSPMKSPRSVNFLKCEKPDQQQLQLSQKMPEIKIDTSTGNNLVIAKPIESHSIGFRILKDNSLEQQQQKHSDFESSAKTITPINNCKKMASEKQISKSSSKSFSCPFTPNPNCSVDSTLKMYVKAPDMISSSPPCPVNRCVPFNFRMIRQELQSVIKSTGKYNRKNNNSNKPPPQKRIEMLSEDVDDRFKDVQNQEENPILPSTSSMLFPSDNSIRDSYPNDNNKRIVKKLDNVGSVDRGKNS